MNIRYKSLSPHAVAPTYATDLAAGFDLVATEDVIVRPGETSKVPTGLAFELPPGYELQVRPRSGVSLDTKLADYRGEVAVLVDNVAPTKPFLQLNANTLDGGLHDTGGGLPAGTYIIRRGDRIAQAVIAPVIRATFTEADELSETERGAGGFGSTGTAYGDLPVAMRQSMAEHVARREEVGE